ncbi:13341_t:CDS:2 [Funneliformis mosseae]|uniref:13341_t:CDS:1 n=1 Tax=Funneliformis mosseae TaxID=27381 RepID=A0A9N9E2R0_FUNMO|nr:13341_t:CDS:2 [Funneliformis mosseae]
MSKDTEEELIKKEFIERESTEIVSTKIGNEKAESLIISDTPVPSTKKTKTAITTLKDDVFTILSNSSNSKKTEGYRSDNKILLQILIQFQHMNKEFEATVCIFVQQAVKATIKAIKDGKNIQSVIKKLDEYTIDLKILTKLRVVRSLPVRELLNS